MTKPNITDKVLELIAREVGNCFSGNEIVGLLKEFGFQTSQIDYPNTKWVTVLEALKLVRGSKTDDPDQAVAELIEHFLLPLNHEPHPENADVLAEKVGRFLEYNKFSIVSDKEKHYVITPDNQTDWNEVDNFFREEKEKESVNVVPEKKDLIYQIRDFHQAYIDVLEMFCENTKKPKKEHNEAYLKLAKKIPQMIEKLNLKHNKVDFYRPFEGDLYSAEIEWNGTDAIGDFRLGPKLSWDAIRPYLYKVHSDITKLIHIAEQEEEMTPDEKLLEQITGMVATHRTEKAKDKKPKEKAEKHKSQMQNVVHEHRHHFENSIQEKDLVLNVHDIHKEQKSQTPKFPYKIQSGTTWDKFYIQFRNPEAVTIRVSGHIHDTSYADMGFVDGRTDRPNMQWGLLLLLAKNGGSLTTGNPKANDKYKKHKQLLSDTLKSYFSMDTDPFKPYEKDDGYEIKMTLAYSDEADAVIHKTLTSEVDDIFQDLTQ